MSMLSSSPKALMMLTISLAMMFSHTMAMTKAAGTNSSCRDQWGTRRGRRVANRKTDGKAAALVKSKHVICYVVLQSFSQFTLSFSKPMMQSVFNFCTATRCAAKKNNSSTQKRNIFALLIQQQQGGQQNALTFGSKKYYYLIGERAKRARHS